MLRIGHRLIDLCEKLNVKYMFDADSGTFYFDKKGTYGKDHLSGKEFIKPIYEHLYKESLLI
jgi:hypothetical protein